MRTLAISKDRFLRGESVEGIFDLDNASTSARTRIFLEKAEREGRLCNLAEDIPRSLVLSRDDDTVYLSPFSFTMLKNRLEEAN